MQKDQELNQDQEDVQDPLKDQELLYLDQEDVQDQMQ
jgi:hypothetical protein